VRLWAEFKAPDMTGSCTNPFVQMYPRSRRSRASSTRAADVEIIAGVCKALGKVMNEPRLLGRVEVRRRRIDRGLPAAHHRRSPALPRATRSSELIAKAAEGGPGADEQPHVPAGVVVRAGRRGEQPWHTKSGRLEFYRIEPEFIEARREPGRHREPVDSTFHEPNVIVGPAHPAIRPKTPGLRAEDLQDLSTETRQVRNVQMSADEDLVAEQAPAGRRKGTRTSTTRPSIATAPTRRPVDTDFTGVLFGPFGDVYRHDKRMPSVTEGYVDINPDDAPGDGPRRRRLRLDRRRPVRTARSAAPSRAPKSTRSRACCCACATTRARPGNVARTWHNMYGATFGSVRATRRAPTAREEPRDELPGDVSLRVASERHPGLAQARR
jgi:nitrate reductase alpha subunit